MCHNTTMNSSVKALAENEKAFKRLREDVQNEILPRHLITPTNIWTSDIPSEPHIRSWYALKALEIVQFFVSKNRKLAFSIIPFIEKIRRVRVEMKRDIIYPKTVGAGKASMNTIFFLLECNALILENRYKEFELDKSLWIEKRGFIDNATTQQDVTYNVRLLQKLWYKIRPTLDPHYSLLNWLEYQVAQIVLINEESPFRLLNGEDGRDCLIVVEHKEDPKNKKKKIPLQFKTASMRYKNDMACIFLSFFESFSMWREIIQDDDVELVQWNQEESQMNHWFEEIPAEFFQWFEKQTRIVADAAFRARVVAFAMVYDMHPGEMLVFLAKNNNVNVTDAIRVFQETRTIQQRNWWMRDALENDMFIDFRLLFSTGRHHLWTTGLLCVFDSVMQSRCKFKWKDRVFYSESRFRECQLDVLSSEYPTIVQVMGLFLVFYNHVYYMTGTLDKSIFYWVYILVHEFDCQFKDDDKTWDLTELNVIWLEWTTLAKTRNKQEQQDQRKSNAKRMDNIIINEDSVLTTFDEE